MLLQHDNYGFSVPVALEYMGRSKAPCEGNGYSLGEHCNAVAGHHRDALWVSLSTPMDCVEPLDKEVAIACEARLAMNVDKLTEFAIIVLKEH